MQENDFDKFAEEYWASHARNIAVTGETPEFFAEYKVRDLAQLLWRPTLAAPRVLDFGSGVGNSIPWFHKYLLDPDVTCVDVSRKSLAIAKERFPGLALFEHFDGRWLPLADGSIDVAFAACVFHHIPHAEHPGLLRELLRVLRPGGRLVIFEHNPINPLTVHAVNTCPFDADAVLLRCGALRQSFVASGFVNCKNRYRLFFPHFARVLRPLERYLGWLPLGAQYYVYGEKLEDY